ncbi:MAG: HD domain-containing protein [Oscillospiraceae bacterium]|nr:HD domain-containing protein [Oscillospiraceae bacterium]
MMIPAYVTAVTERLRAAGYDAYLAGGCVRDTLLGKVPHDYDVATNARPDTVQEVFADHRTILTGERHGTVTVVSEGENIEITTYRSDGEYTDHRRPDSVSFSDSPEDDVSRRDLTINAMLLDPATGDMIDLFGGKDDLDRGIIRCVGDPDKRFGEDALRIMRTLRFASVLGFEIESGTAESVHRNRELLNDIAVERIASELAQLLSGKAPFGVLSGFSDVIAVVVPEIADCIGYDQKSPHHSYDVWTHTCYAVERSEPVRDVRLALMLHDIEKPSCCYEKDGRRHFPHHAEASAVTAEKILRRLRFDNRTVRNVTALVRYHEIDPQAHDIIPDMKRLYGMIGGELFRELFFVAEGDNRAKGDMPNERLELLSPLYEKIAAYADGGGCTSLDALAVNGRDISSLGYEGKDISRVLGLLLDFVLHGGSNDRDVLLEKAEGFRQ